MARVQPLGSQVEHAPETGPDVERRQRRQQPAQPPGRQVGLAHPAAGVLAKIGGTVLARVDVAAPWGIESPKLPIAVFHTVVDGSCRLRRPGAQPIRLATGDLVLLPVGAGHVMSGAPSRPATAYDDLVAAHPGHRESEVHIPGPGPRTQIICGGYRFDGRVSRPLLTLPPVLVLPAAAGEAHERSELDDTLRMLRAELAEPRPGSRTVVDRLTDVLFVHIVRRWTAEQGDHGASWVLGLRDPQVAAAISLLHEGPAQPWTVEELAHRVGVSRATLSRRFTELVGEPPLAYLTRRRLELAGRRLRDTADALPSVARSVGYTSVSAFSRAFTRQWGTPPSRHRTDHHLP
ncbi:AraC family transcriptional regulator [Streptomyces sp. BK340]|uniref:AraC family transcriptional regulator n=1 Tax=Streptomyces sp. BK340 TaxID=2572903 RepID=UPI00119DBA83|nr:AraC family transcriptional regulator [Streptomyces sp. BK340]TVZ84132.1 AraC family transcriptional regulator [Streptomyces sp. BK340]